MEQFGTIKSSELELIGINDTFSLRRESSFTNKLTERSAPPPVNELVTKTTLCMF
jgi:hypothetical protein